MQPAPRIWRVITSESRRRHHPSASEAGDLHRLPATFKDGYLYANETPGWGIEVDEKAAAKTPFADPANGLNGGWGDVRRMDGTVIKQ